jgi:hypothetical protein
MPSASDIFNELKGANQRLDNILAAEQGIRDAVEQVDQGVDTLVGLQQFANNATVHQIKQLDTVICLLRQIANNTCGLLNESHTQTGHQEAIARDAETLAVLYSVTHAEAAIVRQREEALRRQIEECCPPREPAPPCKPAECPDPGPFETPSGGVILKERPPRRARSAS